MHQAPRGAGASRSAVFSEPSLPQATAAFVGAARPGGAAPFAGGVLREFSDAGARYWQTQRALAAWYLCGGCF